MLHKRCSLELNEWEVRRRLKWLPRDSRLIFVREPNLQGWTTRWFVLLLWDEGQFVTIPVLSQTFIVSSPGSNQTITLDPAWNDNNNKIEVIGGGGSGGVGVGSTRTLSGGGGGGYSSVTNFPKASGNLGSGSCTGRVGIAGPSQTRSAAGSANGAAGGDTWVNATAFPTTGTAVGARAGGAGQEANPSPGGTGGAAASGYAVGGAVNTKFSGGRGGNANSNGCGTGGGGAGGPNGDGKQGVDTTGTNQDTNGGDADNSAAGAGTGGVAPGGNGVAGTELGDSVHGCGGGGAGNQATGTNTSGAGGLYGGGSGGSEVTSSGTATSAIAGQGIIVLTWIPPDISMTDKAIFCMP